MNGRENVLVLAHLELAFEDDDVDVVALVLHCKLGRRAAEEACRHRLRRQADQLQRQGHASGRCRRPARGCRGRVARAPLKVSQRGAAEPRARLLLPRLFLKKK